MYCIYKYTVQKILPHIDTFVKIVTDLLTSIKGSKYSFEFRVIDDDVFLTRITKQDVLHS